MLSEAKKIGLGLEISRLFSVWFCWKVPAEVSLEHGHRKCSSPRTRKKEKRKQQQQQQQKKKQGAWRLARCQQRAQVQTYPWVGGFLVLGENQGEGGGGERGDFVNLITVLCQKAVQSQRVVTVAKASQINAVTHNHNSTSRAWVGGSDWLVISFMGGERE